ncbi:hypothetical protein ACYRCD_000097 [Enterococcus hirae]|nr:hypothetical protein [Enterococcus hirae]MDU4271158.1 hypothetical protein [Enterococcus hirae]
MSYQDIIKFIKANKDNISAETESYVEFSYTCKVNEIDNSLFAKLPDFPFEGFVVILDGYRMEYDGLDSFKKSYDSEGEKDQFLLIDDEVNCRGKINKKILTDNLSIQNCFIFSSIPHFEENINFLNINISTKKTFIGIIDCEDEIFNSGFLVIKAAELLPMITDEKIPVEDSKLFEMSNSLYMGKEFKNYLEFPNTWYPKYTSEPNNMLLYSVYSKQVEQFFYFICNKKISNNEFLIRGYKSIILNIDKFFFERDFSDKISFLLNFYVCSNNQQDKLIIMRNTFSLFLDEHSNSQNLNDKINEIVKSINYNFDLYIQDKIKVFLEQKNKLMQEAINTTKKIQDLTNNLVSQIRTVSLSLLGTVFLSFLKETVNQKTLSIMNLVLLSYIFYFTVNLIIVFKQNNQKKSLLNSLNRYTKELGVINQHKENVVSYENLKEDYLQESIDIYNSYRCWVIFGLIVLIVLFFIMYLSNRIDSFSYPKEILKFLIGY